MVASDGAIWFTDPGYGIEENMRSRAAFRLTTNVYRFDPATGKASVVADDFVRPSNGILFPDEKKLYVIDSAGSPMADPLTSGSSMWTAQRSVGPRFRR